jgi:hypothetical protein
MKFVEVDARNDRIPVGSATVRLPHGQYTPDEIATVIAGKAAELRAVARRRADGGGLPAGTAERRASTGDRRRPLGPKASDVGVATGRFLAAEVKRFQEALGKLRAQQARTKKTKI